MKIRLSEEEIRETCAQYASAKTYYKTSVEDILDRAYFIVRSDADLSEIEDVSVEFEYEA